MQETIAVNIPVNEGEKRDIILSMLSDEGYHAFEETDAVLSAFIYEEKFDKTLLETLLSSFQLNYTSQKIEEKNWNSIWESGFQPVIIDDYVAVRASFHSPIPLVLYDLIITPKMSFGTAHHATTYMMIKMMRCIEFKEKRVLDFGTGTGILAILAAKSAAGEVVAIDNDELSIMNALENVAANDCPFITVSMNDSTDGLGKFDIILANINLNILIENLGVLKKNLFPSGILILSGILHSDSEYLLQTAGQEFGLIKKLEMDGWVCLMLKL
jgi:ribosomal protein L11 methyltransferase